MITHGKAIKGEKILKDLRQGLDLIQIQKKYNLSQTWHYGPRAKKLERQVKRETEREKQVIPCTVYRLTPEEVKEKYGRSGLLAERHIPYTWTGRE